MCHDWQGLHVGGLSPRIPDRSDVSTRRVRWHTTCLFTAGKARMPDMAGRSSARCMHVRKPPHFGREVDCRASMTVETRLGPSGSRWKLIFRDRGRFRVLERSHVDNQANELLHGNNLYRVCMSISASSVCSNFHISLFALLQIKDSQRNEAIL